MAKSRARKARQQRREEQQVQGTTDHDSTMDFDQEDDDRRRNSSSEDEGVDDNNLGQLATQGAPIDPAVAHLVNHASQMSGAFGADGTAMALAATNAPNAAEALNLLAASSAVANMKVQRAHSHAAHAVTASDLATEGLRNSDSTYEKRFSHYNAELQKLQNRVAFLEGLLSRVLSMMQNGNIDAAEVAQMLQKLGI
ncbi:hypothetical protein SLS64_001600 [Diaporthe eres]|uniref:BZIP transcription factor n=1 Tax=Diaporthe eres TaxID=83184 RepID=A0ABR1PDZ8_DIAER